MFSAGDLVDAYPDETVWSDALLDAERASMEIRIAPIFKELHE